MKKHTEELKPLIKIGNVTIYTNAEGSYIQFKSDLDVCTDGTGPHHGDKTPQDQTAYYNGGKFLNADKDRYIVIPPQVRKMVAPTVMGCQARMTRISTKESSEAVTGEIGPDDKTGEAAWCLARLLNPSVTANSGDSKHDYLYELWPGVPAVVGKKQYKLEPA
jgi:hypothetical protein